MGNVAFFLSSTFNDMQSERDLFREKITPEIESRFRKYGLNVEFIDLRWGIDTKNIPENEANEKILKTCFDEIKKSSPFFIALIGERYGWIPESDNVESACRESGMELTDDFVEKSVTELEIACALHSFASMDRCLFYFRDQVDYGADEEAKNLYVSGGADKKKIEALKRRLKQKYPKQVRTYKADWNVESGRIEGLDEFEKQITQDIDDCLKSELAASLTATNPFDESLNVIDGTVENLAATFAGREKEIESIFDFLENPHDRLMLLCGNSGCGKSSIMAKTAKLCQEKGYTALSFFVGADEACSTAENMLKILTYRLCKILGVKPCFEGDGEADAREIAEQFNRLLSMAAIGGKTVLIVDAVNQFARTAYEEKLKWLNLYALNPAVKIIISCTDDYYQLKYVKALNAVTLDVDYFSDADIATVTERYFKVNHKEINDKLLGAIMGKRGADGNPCRKPLYLMTLLQELNNIGGDDFKTIKERERVMGESSVDAIINYLAETAERSPVEFKEQLERLFEKVKAKAGAGACEIFACAIAMSRRGVSERFIEKLCKRQSSTFDSANFSYFKKLLKNNLCQRENGAWDFNHGLVKDFFNTFFGQMPLYKSLLNASAECLKEEDDLDPFKRTDYVRYLALADRLDEFCGYFSKMKEDTQVVNSLILQTQEMQSAPDGVDKLLYPVTNCTADIWRFFERTIAAGDYLPKASEVYANKVLNCIYTTEYAANTAILDCVFKLYSALGTVAVSAGYFAPARDYLQMALKIAETLGYEREKYPVYSALATCYFNLGNGLKRKKYWNMAELTLEKSVENGCESDLPALIAAYVDDCEQKLKEVIINKKVIKKYLFKAYSKLELAEKSGGVLSKNELALWYSKILYVCGYAAINAFSADERLEKFAIDVDDKRVKTEILFNLGTYYSCNDLKQAKRVLSLAKDSANELLSLDETEENLLLLNKIIETFTPLAEVAKEDVLPLKMQQSDCLNRINSVSPQYEMLQRQIAFCGKDREKKGELKRLRRAVAHGQISAEHKAANKILAVVVGAVLFAFLVALPLFYSVFRGEAIRIFAAFGREYTSAYRLFVDFYIGGAFETITGLSLYLTLYGVLQIFSTRADYKTRVTWIKRSVMLFVLFIALFAVFYVVYDYVYKIVGKQESNFNSWEIPYSCVLFGGFILLVIFINEIFNFVTKERLRSSKIYNYQTFVSGYVKNVTSYIINFAVLGLAVLLYWLGGRTLIPANRLSATAAPVLVYTTKAFTIAASLIGGLLVAKIIYLTSAYFAIKVKYGKIFKN